MTDHAFQTEVQSLLHLMIHSLYSEREIFLRELIANANDACDKLRFVGLTDSSLLAGDSDMRIQVDLNKDTKTIEITDNGIGLTEEQAIEHLGTIAKSGTKAFLQEAAESGRQDLAGLIGQFGVGFYSSFMVADKVVVESRSATVDSDHGVRWESAGDGNFTTEQIARPQRGTTITLHLKDDADEYLDGWRLRTLIKKYSDYVAYPVQMLKEVTPTPEGDDEEPKDATPEWEQVNSGQALWTRSKDDITEEQYKDFYQAACKQWDEPASRLHFSVEGTLALTSLVYIPSTKPMDLFDRDRRGLSLYVRRVFIMDDCTDLLPEYLRFVRGVVDSDDLPLNVSREMLQQQDAVKKISKILTKRILDHLTKLSKSEDEAEQKAWTTINQEFGPIMREGLVNDYDNRDKLAKLARFESSWTVEQERAEDAPAVLTSYAEYIERMPEGQEKIYVLIADSTSAALQSPLIEGYRKKGFEVLFYTDSVDHWVSEHFSEFDGKTIVNLAKSNEDLRDEDAKEALEKANEAHKEFLGWSAEQLGKDIKEVRLTDRLTDSPCVLVDSEHGMTGSMAEMMRRMGQEVMDQPRILELNGEHSLVQALQSRYADEGDRDQAAGYLQVLRDQAVLAEGGRLNDPQAFAKRVQDLMGSVLA
jgi:molecular chaperone HtpG